MTDEAYRHVVTVPQGCITISCAPLRKRMYQPIPCWGRIVAVHRMYVVPEDWDTKPAQSVQNDIEMWCFSCRTHYPHVQVD